MATRKIFHLPPKPVFDLQSMFVETAKNAVRNAGIGAASGYGKGLVLRANRSAEALASLGKAAKRSADGCQYDDRHDWARAMEHAGLQVRRAYIEDWWIREFVDAPPEHLDVGDEYYSGETIREIMAGRKTVAPDRAG